MSELHINSVGEVMDGDRLLTLAEVQKLGDRESALVRYWERLSTDYGTDLFRFYGRMDEEGFRTLDFETEFVIPLNDADVRAKFEDLCKSFGADFEVMGESPEENECHIAFNLNVFGQDHESIGLVVKRWREEVTKRGLNDYWLSLL